MGFIDYIVDYFRGPQGVPGPTGPAGEPGPADWTGVQLVNGGAEVIGDGDIHILTVSAPSGTRMVAGGYSIVGAGPSANFKVFTATVDSEDNEYVFRVSSDTDLIVNLRGLVVPAS